MGVVERTDVLNLSGLERTTLTIWGVEVRWSKLRTQESNSAVAGNFKTHRRHRYKPLEPGLERIVINLRMF